MDLTTRLLPFGFVETRPCRLRRRVSEWGGEDFGGCWNSARYASSGRYRVPRARMRLHRLRVCGGPRRLR